MHVGLVSFNHITRVLLALLVWLASACSLGEAVVTLGPTEPAPTAIDHWEMALTEGDLWHYFPGESEPDPAWKTDPSVASSWAAGAGGIGYGDDDDTTIIEPTLSLYMTSSFELIELRDILEATLYIDYDDAYVAYLNGVEIARNGIGIPGDTPAFDAPSDSPHEAQLYSGGLPEVVALSVDSLVQGQNHLAIQIHNTSLSSSDMSARVFVAVGMTTDEQTYQPLPEWFKAPMTSSNLPIILINTDGQPIVDDPRMTATMQIINNGPDARNVITDPPSDYDGPISIEHRGSTSQGFPKKQYGFETQDAAGDNHNTSLLGMPEENDWILNAPYSDKSLMRNVLAYDLGRAMGRYAPRAEFCEVFLNGRYEGVYVLLEKIKRDTERVNIQELGPSETSGGYIIKIDKFTGAGGEGWQSPVEVEGWNSPFFQFEDPEAGELSETQRDYISNYVSEFEAALMSDDFSIYRDFIELGSFVDFMIVQEVSRNVDAYRLSTFLHKHHDNQSGRLHAGPLWDFNLGFGNANYMDGFETAGWAFNESTPFWWARFFDDPVFTEALRCRWEELRGTVLSDASFTSQIAGYETLLLEAQERNFQRWSILGQHLWPNYVVGESHAEEVDYLETWTLDRIHWLDENIPGACTTSG